MGIDHVMMKWIIVIGLALESYGSGFGFPTLPLTRGMILEESFHLSESQFSLLENGNKASSSEHC